MRRAISIFVLVAASSVGAAGITQQRAIGIATDHLRSFRTVDVVSLKVSAQHRTGPPDDALAAIRPRLAHRAFWLVYFSPRKSQLGGAYAVYIAADSGEVLGWRGYKLHA